MEPSKPPDVLTVDRTSLPAATTRNDALVVYPGSSQPMLGLIDEPTVTTNQRSPLACRDGRAASMNSGVKICTH